MHLTVVDAFAEPPHLGNPAAVAVLDAFPTDERMQSIAAEMDLSETAFAVRREDGDYNLRWFSPAVEVNLCGHATLATAFVVGTPVRFHTRSGVLICGRSDGCIEMDFPALQPLALPLPHLPAGVPVPRWTGTAGDDWLIELESAEQVVDLAPDFDGIRSLGRRGLIVTAAAAEGSGYDIVSRMFAPNTGIDEDPVTGSAHCALAAYWTPKLGRDELVGYQASSRGGVVRMRLEGDRVILGGRASSSSEVELES